MADNIRKDKDLDLFPDLFDDSNLTFRSEFIERMRRMEKEKTIPFEDLDDILD